MERSLPPIRRIHPVWPVFRIERPPRTALYAPGHLAVVDPAGADDLEAAWRTGREPQSPAAQSFLLRARQVVEQARDRSTAPFSPQCLAVSLGNRCNLQCSYCYSAGAPDPSPQGPSLQELNRWAAPAARLVASNCARAGSPFQLVLQGDGEPTLAWEAVQQIVGLTRQAAASAGAAWSGYISTNGVLSGARASWIAQNFSRVSLSCDGPPEIQDAQRPLPGGGASSSVVAATARTIRSRSDRLDVRATITPATLARQCEILAFLRDALGATHVRFEPVYRSTLNPYAGFSPDEAEPFATQFLKAQREAQAGGVELSLSGVRLDEIHGPYCDVLRQTLRLNPAGAAIACFRCGQGDDTGGLELEIGGVDPATGRFILQEDRIAPLRASAARIPAACHECVNVLHCARTCPDDCPIGADPGAGNPRGSFRCRLHTHLAQEWLTGLLH